MLAFIAGLMIGGMVGVFAMCLCQISGAESRREERWLESEALKDQSKTNHCMDK